MKDFDLPKLNTCIIIPCYNEEKRLPKLEYQNFLQLNSEVLLCFVNDGSTDKTLEVLLKLKNECAEKIEVISYKANLGKAEAIRKGMHYCNKNYDFTYIAYLDADLSTSLEECLELTSYINSEINFVFGSRIMKVGSTIVRNQFRFIVGRFIATIISNILKLKVYDTQCGCKIFTKELANYTFKDPFISTWLFDVEIFNRIINYFGREKAIKKMLEVPLKKWIDAEGSSVSILYFFRIWIHLYQINKICKVQAKTNSQESKLLNKNA